MTDLCSQPGYLLDAVRILILLLIGANAGVGLVMLSKKYRLHVMAFIKWMERE